MLSGRPGHPHTSAWCRWKGSVFTHCTCQVRQVSENAVSDNTPRNRKGSWDDGNRTHVLVFSRPSI